MTKTLFDDFMELAERETGSKRDEITSLWWNKLGGKLNGLVEIDGERVRIGEIPSIGSLEIMKSVISTSLHIRYRDDTACNTEEVLSHAIAIKDALTTLYPLSDSEWSEVLRDIGTYATCLC